METKQIPLKHIHTHTPNHIEGDQTLELFVLRDCVVSSKMLKTQLDMVLSSWLQLTLT